MARFTLIALPVLISISSCASNSSETRNQMYERASAACPELVRNESPNQNPNIFDTYTVRQYNACDCITKSILSEKSWDDETASFSGPPLPLSDAKLFADEMTRRGATLSKAVQNLRRSASEAGQQSLLSCTQK